MVNVYPFPPFEAVTLVTLVPLTTCPACDGWGIDPDQIGAAPAHYVTDPATGELAPMYDPCPYCDGARVVDAELSRIIINELLDDEHRQEVRDLVAFTHQ